MLDLDRCDRVVSAADLERLLDEVKRSADAAELSAFLALVDRK